MKMRHWLLGVALMGLPLLGGQLDDGFANPPNSAKPQAWWHWMHCNITRDGITKDLEAMKKVGIGGATILDISDAIPVGPVKTCSDEWYDLVQFALEEADRLGLELSFHNCPGWSSSGGPWVSQENAMKMLTYAESQHDGGARLVHKLPMPPTRLGFYRDIAVLAFPALPGDGYRFADTPGITLTSSLGDKHAENLFRKRQKLTFHLSDKQKSGWLQFTFDKPYMARMVSITLAGSQWWNTHMNVSVSDDGINFRPAAKEKVVRATVNSICFDQPETFKVVRLEFPRLSQQGTTITNVEFTPHSRIPNLQFKAGQSSSGNRDWGNAPEPESIIPKDSILNLTDNVSADGTLTWDAPAGRWTILRLGFTLTARRNHPVTKWGSGLECDKLSRAGVKNAWDGMMARIINRAGRLAGKALKGTLIDSYEVGPQNWTDDYPQQFQRLRGYDCIKLLPVITGRYVESQAFTERFLADLRRTTADLFAECYAEYFGQLARQAGLDFMSEPYGGPFDEMLQGRFADIPMAEFWGGGETIGAGNSRLASNIAQVNGRRYVGTESFTASPRAGRWLSHPAIHKAQGDNAFAQGINRFIFHDYAHQPWDCKGPGMTMGQWGFHFNRHNTLWPNYTGWLSYLARAQFLLQQGHVISDALYIANEDAPSGLSLNPAVPNGYHSNCVDARSFLEQVELTAPGRLGFSHGLDFPLLVAMHTQRISPQLLKKIANLVEGGATVLLGKRPESSFGLKNYPQSDSDIAQLTAHLWGDLNGQDKTRRSLGKGTVYFGVTPRQIFQDLKLSPDFTARDAKGQPVSNVAYIHRRDKAQNTDFYFVANTRRTQQPNLTLTFRQQGLIPELWNAVTGEKQDAPLVTYGKNTTSIMLSLAQSESVFVVFRRPAPATAVTLTASKWSARANAQAQHDLVIHQATYRSCDGHGGRDVTRIVRQLVANGTLNMSVTNETLRGDPTPMRVKELVIDYTHNGKRYQKVYNENAQLTLPEAIADLPTCNLQRQADGSLKATAWSNGDLQLTASDGTSSTVAFTDVPAPLELSDAWNVHFPAGSGAPERVVFPELMSYTQFENSGVKYFSGTATYKREFTVPAAFANKPLLLDLGTVKVMARIFINGKDCGLLWQAPYRTDVTSFIKPGVNTLEIQVTNRWVNRLIGDEQLPDDSQWTKPRSQGGQALTQWPEWFLKGQPSPTGRLAFTTYKHWHKDDRLLEAGLIGPVILRAGQTRLCTMP